MQRRKEKMMRKGILISKLLCGEQIRRIMKRRREESKRGLIRLIETINSFYFCR
jgi:hypothetical protein